MAKTVIERVHPRLLSRSVGDGGGWRWWWNRITVSKLINSVPPILRKGNGMVNIVVTYVPVYVVK